MRNEYVCIAKLIITTRSAESTYKQNNTQILKPTSSFALQGSHSTNSAESNNLRDTGQPNRTRSREKEKKESYFTVILQLAPTQSLEYFYSTLTHGSNLKLAS